jgi:hypothetical protein
MSRVRIPSPAPTPPFRAQRDTPAARAASSVPDEIAPNRVPQRSRRQNPCRLRASCGTLGPSRRSGGLGGLRELRDRERGGAQVLQGMCGSTRARLSILRSGQQRRREVLRRMRDPARDRSRLGRFNHRPSWPPDRERGACRRAPARVDPVRRSRRLHDARRGPRRRGHPRAPVPLLRPCSRRGRPLWRHHREVHRRCGHGGLGHAARPRGRRRAGCPGRPRARRCRPDARPHDPGPGGRPDRRGRGHDRCHQPRHGRR